MALALGVFGVFGGGKMLCDKGIQSEIGTIKTLNVVEVDTQAATIPVISNIWNYFQPKTEYNRTVLVKEDTSVITLPFSKNVKFKDYGNLPVIVTGNYDACAKTLTVNDPTAIEAYIESDITVR